MMENLVDTYPDVHDYRHILASCHHSLVGLLWHTGQVEHANRHCGQCLTLGRALVKEFPEEPRYRDCLLRSLLSLAAIHRHRHQPQEARDVLEEVVANASASPVADRAGHREHILASAYAELADIQEELNEPALAEQARQKAREFGP